MKKLVKGLAMVTGVVGAAAVAVGVYEKLTGKNIVDEAKKYLDSLENDDSDYDFDDCDDEDFGDWDEDEDDYDDYEGDDYDDSEDEEKEDESSENEDKKESEDDSMFVADDEGDYDEEYSF